MRAHLVSSPKNAEVGVPFVVEIEVENTRSTITPVRLDVHGLDNSSFNSSPLEVALFPEEIQRFDIEINLPYTTPAGALHLTGVLITEPENSISLEIDIEVLPRYEALLTASPRQMLRGSKAEVKALVRNEGNLSVAMGVNAIDPAAELQFVVEPEISLVAPQSDASFRVAARKRRPFWGAPIPRDFRIELVGAAEPQSALITFVQKPLINRGILTAATLLLILGMWAVAVIWGFAQAREAKEPAAAVGPSFVLGSDVIASPPLKTLKGNVVAASNGSTIDRGLVKLTPLNEIGTEFSSPVGSDGSFEVPALKPGTYALEIIGEGLISESGQLVRDSGDPLILLDRIAVEGLPVVITGKVQTRSAEPIADALVEVSSVDLAMEPVSITTARNGEFKVLERQSPGEYELVVAAEGFDPTQIRVSVGPGEEAEALVELEAKPGSIAGFVGYEDDGEIYGLAGVTITAESGDISISSTSVASPTETGIFYLSGLPALRDYTLIFEAPGYSTTRLIRSLDAGEQLEIANWVEMKPAYDFVQGTIRNLDGESVENVEITVTDGLNRAYSVSDANGQFSISGRQSDRDYVITFEHPEYLTQAIQINAAEDASRISAVLERAFFSIRGSLKDGAGQALPGIEVLAVSGASEFATVSTDQGSFLLSGLSTMKSWTLRFDQGDKNLGAQIVNPSNSTLNSGAIELGIVTLSVN